MLSQKTKRRKGIGMLITSLVLIAITLGITEISAMLGELHKGCQHNATVILNMSSGIFWSMADEYSDMSSHMAFADGEGFVKKEYAGKIIYLRDDKEAHIGMMDLNETKAWLGCK